MKKATALVLTLVLVLSLGVSAFGSEKTLLKIALTGEKSDVWEHIKAQLALEGIDLQLVFFSDYIIPNTALADGDVDLNAFQTEIFLKNYIAESGADLTVLSYTTLSPMGIYPGQIDSIDALKEGDKISIPNDPTNGGRALLLLQAAGILTIAPEAGLTPTLKDIAENPKNIQVVELAAPQIPTTLDEVALGIINNGIAVTAGYQPLIDSIFIENDQTPGIENYYNVIAVQTSRKDEPAIQRVIELYQTEESKKIVFESSNGSSIPVF